MAKVVIFAVLALLCVTCGKKGEESSAFQSTARTPQKAVTTDPRQDYTKPYLTDEKMAKFIASMKEERNPFEVILKEGGQMRDLGAMREKAIEFNNFARRYGFQDSDDYIAVWGRIIAGQMQLEMQPMADAAKKSTIEMTQQSIKSAQQELKKPDLDPETRKMCQEKLKTVNAQPGGAHAPSTRRD